MMTSFTSNISEGVMKDEVLGKDTQAHVFEYTSSVVVDAKGSVQVGSCPVQFIFCLKEQNKKKLNRCVAVLGHRFKDLC